jgi:hypothetical protein
MCTKTIVVAFAMLMAVGFIGEPLAPQIESDLPQSVHYQKRIDHYRRGRCLTVTEVREFDGFNLRTGPQQCVELRHNGFLFKIEAFTSVHGSMPYIRVRSNLFREGSRQTVIFVVGGPGDTIWGRVEDPFSEFMTSLAREYGEVIIPAYYGTAYRNLWPNPSIERAAAELLAFTDQVEKDAGKKVSLISVSAGGFILNELGMRRAWPMFLINPVLLPMEEIYRERKPKWIYGSPEERSRQIHFLSGPTGVDFLGRATIYKLRAEDYFRSYFGKYYQATIFDEEGRPSNLGDCAKVIVGSLDDQVGLSTAMRKSPHLQVSIVDGIDHVVIDRQWEREEMLRQIKLWRKVPCHGPARQPH